MRLVPTEVAVISLIMCGSLCWAQSGPSIKSGTSALPATPSKKTVQACYTPNVVIAAKEQVKVK
jgi:hypothetical protein